MAWSAERLRDVIESLRARGGDFTEVEVKRGAGGCPQLGPTLCAFGNMPGGGTVVVGLDEADGFAAVGVDDPGAIEQGVASQARMVSPPVHVEFTRATVDGREVVVVDVFGLPSHVRPCRYAGRAYLRQADGDYVMSEQEVQQVLASRLRPRYDAIPVDDTSSADLDERLTREYLSSVRAASLRLSTVSDDEVLRRTRVLEPDGTRLTVAGLYVLGQYPQQFLPSLSVTAAVELDPRSGGRTRDLAHFDGPLPDLLDRSMEWVRRNTRPTMRYSADGHGYDEWEIPLIAVRELVANALVHRDLSPHTAGKRVEIRLKDDMLVIANPGGLYGVSAQQLGRPDGKSAVNEFLYDMCKFVRTAPDERVIEGEGGGIREAERVLRKANMNAPRFIDKGVGFTVLVPRYPLISQSLATDAGSPAVVVFGSQGVAEPGPNQIPPADGGGTPEEPPVLGPNALALEEVLANGPHSVAELVELTGLSKRRTHYALTKLVNAGIVRMNGGQGMRGTAYALAVR